MLSKKLTSVILFVLLAISSGFSQILFKGEVLVFSNVPIIHAKVTNLTDNNSVLTNEEGKFFIKCNLKDKLLIEAEGFTNKKIKVKTKNATIYLDLSRKTKAAEIAISKGHIGNIEEFSDLVKKYTNANNYSRYTSALQIIKDKYSNVKIDESGIIVRGKKSLVSYCYALIEIDGIIVDFSALEDINTATIKNIKVLTASESGMYGARGSNGVVQVTTYE